MTVNINNFTNTIYGVILNDKKSLDTLAPKLSEAPYQAPPKAPILYIKPFNTLNTDTTVTLPEGSDALEIGSSIGLVMGKRASRLTPDTALDALAGIVLAADLSIPHDSYYRPAIIEKCFDGSLMLSDIQALPKDLETLTLTTMINGEVVNTRSLAKLNRSAAQLLADVTEFMTLDKGDVLLLGVEYQAPTAKAGDQVKIAVKSAELADLEFDIGAADTNAQSVAAVKLDTPAEDVKRFGRIMQDGEAVFVTPEGTDKVKSEDGQILDADGVDWLPPVPMGTVFALGLNYADHATELSFKAPEKPLVFLKGKNTLVGHDAQSRRPENTDYMHYECELAIVIGKTAKNISEAAAKDHILGYTVANDYAIRDYLENYYRPNLRVKNRDDCTPIGPWLMRADQIDDPMQLALATRVNGDTTQEGTTADMVFNVYYLVSYLSAIMTLNPGDVILTGTPKGLADVKPGDVVETEIEALGVLSNTIVDDSTYYKSL